jgi:hypothetical protein
VEGLRPPAALRHYRVVFVGSRREVDNEIRRHERHVARTDEDDLVLGGAKRSHDPRQRRLQIEIVDHDREAQLSFRDNEDVV